jgi:hypothetical protein
LAIWSADLSRFPLATVAHPKISSYNEDDAKEYFRIVALFIFAASSFPGDAQTWSPNSTTN